MQKGKRATGFGKALLLFMMAGVGLWTTGCFHEDVDHDHGEHAGWHERGHWDHNDHDHDQY